MKAAEPGDRCGGPDGVHGSVERSILVERKVRTCSVIELDDRTPTVSERSAIESIQICEG